MSLLSGGQLILVSSVYTKLWLRAMTKHSFHKLDQGYFYGPSKKSLTSLFFASCNKKATIVPQLSKRLKFEAVWGVLN